MSEPQRVAMLRFRADVARAAARSGRVAVLVLMGTLMIAQACYHYRAVPAQPITAEEPGGAPPAATDYESETVWALAWGLVQRQPDIDNCEGQGLAEARVTTNLGYALLTIATLGFASPVRIEWKCAKATPEPEPIGAVRRDSRTPSTVSRSMRGRPGVTSSALEPRRSRSEAGGTP